MRLERLLPFQASKRCRTRMGRYALLVGILLPHAAFAATGRAPTPALVRDSGSAAALSGGGTAHVNDLSAAQLNPAGLSLSREFSGGGEIHWQDDSLLSSEAGVMDSVMSEVAAAFVVRQATAASGGRDRRYTLALSERLGGDSPFIVGFGGDYFQIEGEPREAPLKNRLRDNLRLRLGFIYGLSEWLQLGVRSEGFPDKRRPREHAAGVSATLDNYYIFNGDLVFSNEKLASTLLGVTVLAKEYLDLKLSYGYALGSAAHHLGAAGVTLKSQHIRLFYTIAKADLKRQAVDQNFGLALTIVM